MRFKFIFTLISILILISFLFFYFTPFNTFYFIPNLENSNFSILEKDTEMQNPSNMRFPSNEISYQISDCSLKKKNDMQYAFEIIENITDLRFNSVLDNEEISITCEEEEKYNDGIFIAGEARPTNITVARNFNVITKGEILLIKSSDCPKPNVAIHELLHVLGFKHSDNPSNIMYNITNCEQIISQDILNLINELYSTPSRPDLILENVSGIMKGRFLEINFSVINGGLADAGESKVEIYSGGRSISETDIHFLPIGYGRFISIKNIFVSQMNVNELMLVINSTFEEINKENNKVILEIR